MSQDSDEPSQQADAPATPREVPSGHVPDHLEVSFDVLTDLLGGASAKAALDGMPGATSFAASLDAPRAWLSPGITSTDPSPPVISQFALEVLAVKLRCFDALVRMLIGTGHVGGLPDARIQARMLDQPGAMRPARWAFEVVIAPSSGNTSLTSLALDLSNLLAQLLLSNDARTSPQAELLAAQAAEQFGSATSSMASPSSEDLQAAADSALSSGPIADSDSLLYATATRERIANDAIPRPLWLMATKLMLRLRTNLDGFSFGESPLLDLCAELTRLGQHLDIAAFGAMARRAEIEAVVRAELSKLQ